MKSGLLAAVAACGVLLSAPASSQGVKIGILNDQSGVYADYGGKWSVEAAKMRTKVSAGGWLGQKTGPVTADNQNNRDFPTSTAAGGKEVKNVNWITERPTQRVRPPI